MKIQIKFKNRLALIATTLFFSTTFNSGALAQEESVSGKILKYIARIGEAKQLDSAKAIYAQFLREYPEQDHKNTPYFFNMARAGLARTMIKTNAPQALQMIEAVAPGQIRRNSLGGLCNELLKIGKAQEAEAILKKELAPGKSDSLNYYTYSYNYADLLYQLKRYPEALQWITPVNEKKGLKGNQQMALYAYILTENKQYENAFEVLSNLVKEGMATDEMKAGLKKVWLAKGNKAQNYAPYVQGLMKSLNLATVEDLKKHEVNYAAPDFTLTDLNGKEVNLASLKGKVVMLDFWATWCGPCVGAFPAMQKAVNKYKNNKNVVFLFINSWESETNPTKRKALVQKFFTGKPYQFDVLLDPNPGTKQGDYVVISKYGVKGIPAKFIIDKKGNVRYALKGFNGGDDATVEEISIAIDNLVKM
ncbi:redoxin domain-containing protein [Pedobacter nyackensis]|uniref:redoxin domain-containing protein n=1 Tax=Pedobacter nyackensis TaxID=475255 RepID=UPI00292FBF0D|nr:redoxin domain-containing protein [Pedobacter nyackensis]